MLRFDPATLLLAIAALAWLTAALSASAARVTPEHRQALRHWALAMASAGGACTLFLLRGVVPDWLSFAFANSLVLLMSAGIYLAFAWLRDGARGPGWLLAVLGLGLPGVLAGYFQPALHPLAVGTLAGLLSLALLRVCLLLLAGPRRQARAVVLATAGCFGLTALAFGLRALLVLWQPGPELVLQEQALPQAWVLMAAAVAIVAGTLGLFGLIHEEQRERWREAAARDSLTGLLRRGEFFERASAELAALPAGTPYSLAMVDMDHFKRINDEFGHLGGDAVLAHAARLLQSGIRLSDLAGRYGGEEFCVLLPGCVAAQAAEFAQRLVQRAAQQQIRLRDGRTAQFTLSVGHASACQGEEALEDVLARADAALYGAKHAGRNQVVAAPPLLVLQASA